MANQVNELGQVEQELAELQSHLDQSFIVLNGLAKVQTQFEDLAQTYQKLKENLDEVKAVKGDVAKVKESVQSSLYELEVKLRNELHAFKNQLKKAGADQNLETQEKLEHQLRLATSIVQSLERKVRNMELKLSTLSNSLVFNALVTVLIIVLMLLNSDLI